MAMANVSTFAEKTDHKNFETIIYTIAEDLAAANEQPASISNTELKALQVAAKYLMRTYPSQFFPALFAPSSIAKGSLKWLASNYRMLKSETFSDGSEDGTKADKALMAALKSASSQLTDTIDKAMLSMDAMTTVVRSVQSVLGIYSDLLRTSGEPGVVIVSTALTSHVGQDGRGTRNDQPRTPDMAHTSFSRRRAGRDSLQISPTTLISEIDVRGQNRLSSVSCQRPSDTSIHDDAASLPQTASPQSRGFPPAAPTGQSSTPGIQYQRSSSAPPTPTPAKRAFNQVGACPDNDSEPKRPRKERHNSKTPSPTHGPQRQGSGAGQGGAESYRGRGGYQGRNFIQGYIPSYRARGGYRSRETYRGSYSWRGRQPQWSGRGERGEYQGRSRGSEYLPRMNYD